jgi:hypothetical protein
MLLGNIYGCVWCKLCHGNAVKVVWAKWENAYDFVCLVL